MMEPLVLRLGEKIPNIAEGVFLAPGVVVAGEVTLAAGVSLWYHSVIRGDASSVEMGEDSNLQDGCVIHADPGFPAIIGARVTIGHRAVIHGARIEDDVLIGMGAIVMNGAVIRSGSIIAAGAVISQGVEVPPGSLMAGVPGRVLRAARPSDAAAIAHGAEEYLRLTKEHRAGLEHLGY